MIEDELTVEVTEFRRWAATADASEDGWQSDYPAWSRLLRAAKQVMRTGPLTPTTVALLGECWHAAEEDEELLEYASEHIDDCWPAIVALTASPLLHCRWQAYVAAAAAGRRAEPLLRVGLTDGDGYVRRRTLLELARLAPPDAREIAKPLVVDPDPYMRQAAIEMVLAAKDSDFRTEALQRLSEDPVSHVRAAARRALGR
jgi:hypothetical protein